MFLPIAKLHFSVYKLYKAHNSTIRSDDGPTFETTALEARLHRQLSW